MAPACEEVTYKRREEQPPTQLLRKNYNKERGGHALHPLRKKSNSVREGAMPPPLKKKHKKEGGGHGPSL